MQRRGFLLALPALAAALGGCDALRSGYAFKSIDITGNKEYAGDFHLVDQFGQPRSLADFRGKAVTLFFGYLNCPDYCPTHLMRQKEVLKLLGPDAPKLQTLFMTVDPERDSQQALKAYMAAFDPSFIGLRGTPEQTEAAAKAFKVIYRKAPVANSTAYTMEHSTLTIAFDPQGRARLIIRHEQPASEVAADLKLLIDGK
jgi:protein SCO1